MDNLQMSYLNTTKTWNIPITFKCNILWQVPGRYREDTLIFQLSFIKETGLEPYILSAYPYPAGSCEQVA